jgi:hypothetical protein
MNPSWHTDQSSYREMVLEHLFVGEIMKYCWQNNLPRIEMLKSQVDNSGYDVVLESRSVLRHVQLKTSFVGAATPRVPINIELANKPSGCVVWTFFDQATLEFSQFLWLGNAPGEKLTILSNYKIATHNKRNAQGVKTERINIRYIPKSAFAVITSIGELVERLFGVPTGQPQDAREEGHPVVISSDSSK